MFDLKKIVRPHILTLKPYSSARDEYSGQEGVFLDANENPYGTPGSKHAYNRYPDPYQTDLKKAISEIKQVPTSNIFLGHGSDEAIELIIRSFCRPGKDNILVFPPTYGMYEVSADINEISLKPCNLTTDYQIDVDRALATVDEDTKIIFVCSPNNPTGNLLNREDVITLIENFDGLVVVDEAYIDFCENKSLLPDLEKYPNMIVLQTFSKAWGMAGIRLGMAFASTEIIHILNKVKPPYNINVLTQEAALKILESAGGKDKMVQDLTENRDSLAAELRKISFVEKVFPSDANFLLVRVSHSKEVFNFLIEEKVIVRDRSKVILCDDSLRITVGTADENFILVQTLKDFKPQQAESVN